MLLFWRSALAASAWDAVPTAGVCSHGGPYTFAVQRGPAFGTADDQLVVEFEQHVARRREARRRALDAERGGSDRLVVVLLLVCQWTIYDDARSRR